MDVGMSSIQAFNAQHWFDIASLLKTKWHSAHLPMHPYDKWLHCTANIQWVSYNAELSSICYALRCSH